MSYCAEQVRRFDRDRYLTVLFAPAARRAALFALYAFNLEVARAREAVRTPEMGLIRLQWWRDALDELAAGRCRQHPVLEAFASLAPELDPEPIRRLLDARERDHQVEPCATLDEFAAYAADTSGGLLELALQLLGVADAASHSAARRVGTAWGLLGLLRATPVQARAGRSMLPTQLLRAYGLDAAALEAARGSTEMAEVARAVAEIAAAQLAAARTFNPDPAALPVLLLGTLADDVRRRLEQAGYDPWRLPPRIGFAPVRLAYAHWRGRF
jgi:NADH dehydrogenase [ubiquinone] 1 alpha subcomplex assembly factor 6